MIVLYKFGFTGFHGVEGFPGLLAHLGHEWVTLANLLGLLLGFALLARHFEDSGVPHALPRWLPDDWKGGLVLLVMVFVISAFLDNIAAVLIGGTIAAGVFQRRVHIGYLAAIVAASNAGGSGSVVGRHHHHNDVDRRRRAIGCRSRVCGRHSCLADLRDHCRKAAARISSDPDRCFGWFDIDWARLGIVIWILLAAMGTNIFINTQMPESSNSFPFIGVAVMLAILLATPLRKPEWSLLPDAFKGSVFLLSLVMCASMMPVEKLPVASWETAFGLGFVSAVLTTFR